MKLLQSPQPTVSPSNKKPRLPNFGRKDICLNYKPFADEPTFSQQLQLTQDTLVDYLPRGPREQFKKYLGTTRWISNGFWVITFGFVVFCHRIGPLQRLLGNRTWKMFSFKLGMLTLPFMGMQILIPAARQDQIRLTFQQIRGLYKRFKYTGDILELNKQIELAGFGLDEISQEKRKLD